MKFGKKYIKSEFRKDLQNFIIYKLVNSGILDELKEVPLKKNHFVTERITIQLITIQQLRIREPIFHTDYGLYNIITYFDSKNPQVFGSEILLGPNEYIERNSYTEEDGRVASIQNNLNDMYQHTHPGLKTLIRGIYNNGDTLVHSDMLLQHSIPITGEYEIRDEVLLTITQDIRESQVSICSERFLMSEELIKSRSISVLVVSVDRIFDLKYIEENEEDIRKYKNEIRRYRRYIQTYGEEVISDLFNKLIFTVDQEPIPVPEINLSIEEYSTFLDGLQRSIEGDGICSVMDSGEETFVIKNRGGKKSRRRKLKPKYTRNRKYKIKKGICLK